MHLAHRTRRGRLRSEIDPLERVIDQIEELVPEALEEHVFPFARAHHVGARARRTETEGETTRQEGVVVFRDHHVPPRPGRASSQQRDEGLPFQYMPGNRVA